MQNSEAICRSTMIQNDTMIRNDTWSWRFDIFSLTTLAPRCSTQVRGVEGLNLSSPVADFRVIAVQSSNSQQNREFVYTFLMKRFWSFEVFVKFENEVFTCFMSNLCCFFVFLFVALRSRISQRLRLPVWAVESICKESRWGIHICSNKIVYS